MKKLILPILFLLVIFSLNVSARRVENFSASDGYDWLLSQGKKGSYNDDIVDTAAAFLAISAAGGSGVAEKDFLVSQENELKCWPLTNCKTKDTAFSVLALYKSGDTTYTNDAAAWMKTAQKPTLTGGNWWLEIDTPDTGTCKITYTKKDKEFSKDVKVEAGKFPDCGKGTFFDLKSCLEPNLLNNFASLELNVDCSALSSAKISIAYNSGSPIIYTKRLVKPQPSLQ